jgi:uracil-DNA glycosylase family 4
VKEPSSHCALCPRLCEFRKQNQSKYPKYKNAPVPAFGNLSAEVLVVGLAPGLHGANNTGRPFTNDYAGDLLYPTLKKFGLGKGDYDCRADDGFELINCRITNAVRCAPPENKPTPEEIKTCHQFLQEEIAHMPNLRVILALGGIAHNAVLRLFNLLPSKHKFGHGNSFSMGKNIQLIDSYHCSRYNTSTKRLTEKMFLDIFEKICLKLKSKS